MSWAEEDWTVGLTGRVLQKVKELQVHHERLSRENKQKQLQLDNVHISLDKQTVKYEEVRVELQSVQRELQSVQEEAKAAVVGKGRLTQEVQTKQAQVCSLEGQLDAARSQNNKLTQEIKRLEAELEKLQNSSRLSDASLFSTPSWIKTSPWEHNGSRQEVQRDDAPPRAHSRRLHFSDVASPSTPPHRHPSDTSDIFSTPTAAFPWERDDSAPAARRRTSPPSQTPPRDGTKLEPSQRGDSGRGDAGRDAMTAADTSSSELRSRISALEEELSGKARALKSVQNEQMQSKKELAAKEISLQRARDELSVAQTRIAQDSERASVTEHKLKQLQEELKCQRQNAESSRLQHQQRTKELEKQHQRDLTELQRERQTLERQHQQEVNKLNQELQHARTQHNALQAQADKLALQKQELEKDLNSAKEKVKWTEGQLSESQRKETQTQAKLTEAVREAEGVAVSLEQSRKRERVLEEEGRRLAEELADAQRLIKDLQEQKLVSAPALQPAQFCPSSQSYSPQSSFSHPARVKTKRHVVSRAEHKQLEQEDDDEDEEEEELNGGKRTEVTASFPSDREPGEGIDSEHITALRHLNPECGEKAGRRGKSDESETVEEAVTSDVSETNKSFSSHSSTDTTSSISEDGVEVTKTRPGRESLTPPVSDASISSGDLKKENATLRSDLRDLREELQKRLEDLEAQRRAETEARTRLKQLSRKQASQTAEKEEKLKEWKAQLGSERAETERLKKTVAALEAALEVERDRNTREEEEEEEEGGKEKDDRECEMVELNIQLKKQLSDMKTQLAVEREERKQEEEKDQIKNEDMKLKVAELTAELENLKSRLKEDEGNKLSVTSRPLLDLSLCDDELNSNILSKILPSPDHHLLLCQTANQRNVLQSQPAAEIIREERRAVEPESSPPSVGSVVLTPHDAPDLAKEVERLRGENAKETERADRCQVKLEALQNQVTRQTLQLTTAFEKQSQHIAGLLAELREKESFLCGQGDELLRCKKELEALRGDGARAEEAAAEGDGGNVDFDDRTGPTSDLKSKHGTGGVFTPRDTSLVPGDHVTGRSDETEVDIGTFDPEAPEDEQAQRPLDHQCSKTQEAACDVTVQDESQLVTPRTEGLVVPDARGRSSQRDRPEQNQNVENVAVTSVTEDETCDVVTDGQKAFLHVVSTSGDEARESETTGRTNGGEGDREEASPAQVDYLQGQVEALQLKIRALSEEMQQQAEELALWRLASQPAPPFDDDQQRGGGERVGADGQTRQQNADGIGQTKAQTVTFPGRVDTPPPDTRRRRENITVIREDDLLLSCTSNKMQGRMLFSRLQNSNIPDPKILQPSKKSATLQEYEESANMDQESEKENQDVNVLQQPGVSPASSKTKRDVEVVQMFEKTLATKETLRSSGAASTKPDFSSGKPDVTLNSSRGTSEVKAGVESVRSVGVQTDEGPSSGCAATSQTEEEEVDGEELEDSPPLSPVTLPEKDESDIGALFSGSFPIPADPARLAERIRRNRTQLSAAFDDTEYEPYGLPEVVMKGFADIPSGPSCPYIVRRGLLGTSVVPNTQSDSGKEEETD